jgi:hypothetical protein
MSEFGLMCLIALEQPVRLDPEAALAALTRTAPRSDLAVTARAADSGESGLAIRIDGQDYAAVALPGQMPDEICAMAQAGGVFWAQRREALEAHRGFLALSAAEPARGHGLVRAQAVALTRLAAALASATPALGLVWPGAGTAVSADRLDKASGQIQIGVWPVDIWIGFELLGVTREGRRLIGARSRGGTAFFGSEVEVAPLATDDRVEPLRILMNMASHLMAHGPHIRDGQPIQLQGQRPMRVTLIPARDGRPAAIRLVPVDAASA